MLKKVLSVVLALVLALGVLAVATSAASASDLQTALNSLPSEYNAQFYNESTQAAILEARAAATDALASGDPEAVDSAYNLCTAASTLAKAKEERYIEEDDEYVNYYVNRDESRAVAEISLETDAAEYLKAGDTFNVTVSLDANFYIRTMTLGFAYDKTKLEFVSDAYETVEYLSLTASPIQPDFAHNAAGKEKEGGFPNTWDAAKKAQYNIISKSISFDALADRYFKADGMTKLMTLTFRVKENVEDGEALIFLDHDLQATFDELILGTYGLPAIKFTRAYAESKTEMVADYTGKVKQNRDIVDQQATCDQTVNFTTEQIVLKIGEAPVPADYTALDAAIAKLATYNQDEYTEDSWAAYAAAVEEGQKCDRNLNAEDQATIDALTKAITDAEAALEFKVVEECAILSVTPVGAVKAKEYATLDVVVKGTATKLSFVNSLNQTYTITRSNRVLSITDNGNGTETWRITIFVKNATENYQVFAKFADIGWSQPSYKYKLDASNSIDANVYSVEIADAYKGAIYAGKHVVTVKTGTDVTKVQFVLDGSSTTYTASYEDVEGVRVWSIEHNFAKLGNLSYDVRVRTAATVFETSDKTMDVIVVL